MDGNCEHGAGEEFGLNDKRLGRLRMSILYIDYIRVTVSSGNE